MSASPAIPVSRPAAIPTATVFGAVLFAGLGALIGIFAFAFVVAAQVAPAELATHPVGEALLRVTPVLAGIAVAHLAVAVGLLTGAAAARAAAAVVAVSGLTLAAAEIAAIVTGHDPMAAESSDPAGAAQSGLEIMVVLAAAYAVMLVLSLMAPRRGR